MNIPRRTPHVRYGEHRARFEIGSGDLLDGDLPPRAARLVREWADLRRSKLEENWRRVEAMQQPERVEPLS